MFKVTTDTLALRVSLSEGGKRVVSWVAKSGGLCSGFEWVRQVFNRAGGGGGGANGGIGSSNEGETLV